jgi:hypothetical protein
LIDDPDTTRATTAQDSTIPGESAAPVQNETRADDEAAKGNGYDQKVAIVQTLASYVVRSTFAVKQGKPLSKAAKSKWKPADKGLELFLPQLTAHVAKQIVIAVYPMEKGENKTRVGVLDFDDHDKKVEWADMVDAAKRVLDQLAEHSIFAFPVRSRRGRGIHLWIPFTEQVLAAQLRAFLKKVLADCGFIEGQTGGLAKSKVEIFPKQDSLAAGSIDVQIGEEVGSHITLPFAGDSVALDPETFEITTHPELKINGPGPIKAFGIDEQPAPRQNRPGANPAFDGQAAQRTGDVVA